MAIQTRRLRELCPSRCCSKAAVGAHLSERQVLSTLAQTASALAHLHGAGGVSHRDVKPANVLLDVGVPLSPLSSSSSTSSTTSAVDGRSPLPRVTLIDYGSAGPATVQCCSRTDALRLQDEASRLSSMAYRAPELWEPPSDGEVTAASDVWSLGCVGYACMYGGLSPAESRMPGGRRFDEAAASAGAGIIGAAAAAAAEEEHAEEEEEVGPGDASADGSGMLLSRASGTGRGAGAAGRGKGGRLPRTAGGFAQAQPCTLSRVLGGAAFPAPADDPYSVGLRVLVASCLRRDSAARPTAAEFARAAEALLKSDGGVTGSAGGGGASSGEDADARPRGPGHGPGRAASVSLSSGGPGVGSAMRRRERDAGSRPSGSAGGGEGVERSSTAGGAGEGGVARGVLATGPVARGSDAADDDDFNPFAG